MGRQPDVLGCLRELPSNLDASENEALVWTYGVESAPGSQRERQRPTISSFVDVIGVVGSSGFSGKDVALRLDSRGDVVASWGDTQSQEASAPQPRQREDRAMSEQRVKRVEVIGGDEYEVGSMAHAAAVKRRDGEVEDLEKVIEKLEKDLEEAKARADEEKERADEEKKKLDEEKKSLEERLDELEKKFDEMVEERAKERADLLQTAKDEGVDIREDASDHEIRCKLLERLTPGVRFDSKDAAKDGERARIALLIKLEERRAAREKSGVASVAEAVLDQVIGVVDRLIEGIDDLAQEMADTRGAVAGLDENMSRLGDAMEDAGAAARETAVETDSVRDAAMSAVAAGIGPLVESISALIDRMAESAAQAVVAADSLEKVAAAAEEAGDSVEDAGGKTEKAGVSLGKLAKDAFYLAAAKKAFDWISGVANETASMMSQFQMTTEEIATLRTVARDTGLSMGEVARGMKKLAGEFGGQTADAYEQLELLADPHRPGCARPPLAPKAHYRVCTLPDLDHPMAEAWVYENAID